MGSARLGFVGSSFATLCVFTISGFPLGEKVTYNTSVPLNEWPFVEAHDSATGYLEADGIIKKTVYDWTKTQVGGLGQQLGCGARAFDWRPSLVNGVVMMHHGAITIKHKMADAITEVVTFANANPADEDLIVLAVTACAGGDQCLPEAIKILNAVNISVITDCTALAGLSYADALERSHLSGGGHVLAVVDCLISNYEPSIACSGTDHGDYTCYNDSKTKAFPLNRMLTYLEKIGQTPPATTGYLSSTQALWQESDESVVIGELHLSSLLLDESRSNLNEIVTGNVANNTYRYINFLEMNDVCHGGQQLRDILLKRVAL
eukprot:m.1078380 g.1078380  ORF g.1078380 m.1078380 type:complete len:320 (-) comp24253_c0_seq1:131-1090(-)